MPGMLDGELPSRQFEEASAEKVTRRLWPPPPEELPIELPIELSLDTELTGSLQ
jgi:hypothetical protein